MCGLSAQADEVDKALADALTQARKDAYAAEQGKEGDALKVIAAVSDVLKHIDPKVGKASLNAWYHGHRTLLIAHQRRLADDNGRHSLDVAREMQPIAERGLHPDLKALLPEKHVFMLEEKAVALLELARYTFIAGKDDSREPFAKSLQVFEEALACARTAAEKARIHDRIAFNHEVAARKHLAADRHPEGFTPKVLKECCGQSAQLALAHTRMAIHIARDNDLASDLAQYRCNFMVRLDNAHYWRTNRPLASDSEEYLEGVAQLAESVPYAKSHPDDSVCARVLDYHEKAMSIPGIERDERFERFRKNFIEPMIPKPITPWWIREY